MKVDVPIDGSPDPEPTQTTEQDDPQPVDLEVPEGVDPASIPEKFRRADGQVDWAALVTSHNYLEANRGAQPSPTETPEGTPPPAKPTEGAEPLTPEAAYPYVQEYNRLGRLSDTSYRVIEKQFGYTREQVDNFVSAQSAREKVYYQAVADSVGGREQWDEVVAWADRALPPDRLQFFSQQIHGGNQAVATQAARSLLTEYQSATTGVRGGLIEGSPAGGGERVKPFPSVAAKNAALKKKNDKGQFLMDVDEEYAREVEARHRAMLIKNSRRR